MLITMPAIIISLILRAMSETKLLMNEKWNYEVDEWGATAKQ